MQNQNSINHETTLAEVFSKISDERTNQILKWGHQNHNSNIWFQILIEEVYEVKDAFSGKTTDSNIENLKYELVQVAAVCVAWLQDIKIWEEKEHL